MTRALRSVSKKVARSKEPELVDLDEDESVSERVARLITQQAVAIGVAHRLMVGRNHFASHLACRVNLTGLQEVT